MITTVPLKDIPYIDYPELQMDEHESTEMPFRYVRNTDGSPCMPKVRCKISILNHKSSALLIRTGNDGLDQSRLGEGMWRLTLSVFY